MYWKHVSDASVIPKWRCPTSAVHETSYVIHAINRQVDKQGYTLMHHSRYLLLAAAGHRYERFSPGPEDALAPQKQPLAFSIVAAPTGAPQAPSLDGVVSVGPAVPISALAFSPDGKLLAVGGYREVLLSELAGNACQETRCGTDRRFCAVRVFP